jgi:hypothetical protein
MLVSACSSSPCNERTQALAAALEASPPFAAAFQVAQAAGPPIDRWSGCFDDNSGDASIGAGFSFNVGDDFDIVSAKILRALRATPAKGLSIDPQPKEVGPGLQAEQALGTWVFQGEEFSISFGGGVGAYTFELTHPLEP